MDTLKWRVDHDESRFSIYLRDEIERVVLVIDIWGVGREDSLRRAQRICDLHNAALAGEGEGS